MGPQAAAGRAGAGPHRSAKRRLRPRTPDDLAHHRCIQYRRAADGALFEWSFERDGEVLQSSVDGRVMVNDTDLAIRAAVDGLGIAYVIEPLADPFLRSGQLVRVLEDWSPKFDGLFLYYPGHRQVPVALRALIDMLRTARGSAPAKACSNILGRRVIVDAQRAQACPSSPIEGGRRPAGAQPHVPGCERCGLRELFMKVSHRPIKFAAIE